MKNSLNRYVVSAVAAVVLLSVGTTSLQAFAECGATSGPNQTITCNGSSYTNGIDYFRQATSPITPGILDLNNSSMVVSTRGIQVGNQRYRSEDVTILADDFTAINTTIGGITGRGLMASTAGDATIHVKGGSISTTGGISSGMSAMGILAEVIGTSPSGKGAAVITLQNTSVTTQGRNALGVVAYNGPLGSSYAKASIDINNSIVRTKGNDAAALYTSLDTASNSSESSIAVHGTSMLDNYEILLIGISEC